MRLHMYPEMTGKNTSAVHPEMKLTEQMIEDLQDVQYDPDDYEEAKMPTMKAKTAKTG